MRKSKNQRLQEWAEVIADAKEVRLRFSEQQLRSGTLPRLLRRPFQTASRRLIRLMAWVERHARQAAQEEIDRG